MSKFKICVGNLTLFEANNLLKHLVDVGYGVGTILEDPFPTGNPETSVSSSTGCAGRRIVAGSGGRLGRKDRTIHVVESNTHFKSLAAAANWLKSQDHRASSSGVRKAIAAGTRYCGHLWEYTPSQPINESKTL